MNTFKNFIAIHKGNFEAIKKVLELLLIKIVCRHDMLSIFFAYISTIGQRKIFTFDLLTKRKT